MVVGAKDFWTQVSPGPLVVPTALARKMGGTGRSLYLNRFLKFDDGWFWEINRPGSFCRQKDGFFKESATPHRALASPSHLLRSLYFLEISGVIDRCKPAKRFRYWHPFVGNGILGALREFYSIFVGVWGVL